MERLKPNLPAIQASWERIFDPTIRDIWMADGRKQACIDRLYPEEVIAVTPIRRRVARRLPRTDRARKR